MDEGVLEVRVCGDVIFTFRILRCSAILRLRCFSYSPFLPTEAQTPNRLATMLDLWLLH